MSLPVIFATLLSCELIYRLPLTSNVLQIKRIAKRSIALVSSQTICDRRKEAVVPLYSLLLMKKSFFLFLYFLLILAPLLGVAIAETSSLRSSLDFFTSFTNLMAIAMFSGFYIVVRGLIKYGKLFIFRKSSS